MINTYIFAIIFSFYLSFQFSAEETDKLALKSKTGMFNSSDILASVNVKATRCIDLKWAIGNMLSLLTFHTQTSYAVHCTTLPIYTVATNVQMLW